MLLILEKIKRKLSRNEEIQAGRVNHNRVHANKKAYSRKKMKRLERFESWN